MKKIIAILLCLTFINMALTSYGAVDASTVWEIRTTGASTGGGGYVAGGGGTDYSQQDAAEASNTDLVAANGVYTRCYSAAVDFNQAKWVGNIINITDTGAGGNFIIGRYEITAVGNDGDDYIDIDRDCATGNDTGGDWYLGGALSSPADLFVSGTTGCFAAGNTIYVKAGTYTLTENVPLYSSDGTAALPVKFTGYNSARGDAPTGDNRPLIAIGAYYLLAGSYSRISNFRVTHTGSYGFASYDANNISFNHKSVNTSNTANRVGLLLSNSNEGFGVKCEGKSKKGYGIKISSYGGLVLSYAYDSATGIFPASYTTSIISNIIDSCKIGIDLGNLKSMLVVNNTIYNCTTGISGTTAHSSILINNILDANITGASWTTATLSNYWDNNCWNNTTDVSNVTKGDNAVTADPLLNTTIVTGSNGTTEAGDETDFRSVGATFQTDGVSTGDVLVIHSGTSVTTGVYTITAIVNETTLTISAGATTGASSCVYGIVTNEDFTVGSGSPALDAGAQVGTDIGLTGDYKWNIGVDQDDVTTGGGTNANGAISIGF